MTEIKIIERASNIEIENIKSFYNKVGYGAEVASDDRFLVASEYGQIIGIVRLAYEGNLWLLRGMQIDPHYRRKKLGSKLLNEFRNLTLKLNAFPTYCIPYEHLEKFYNLIGFEKLDSKDAPPFLQERLSQYFKKRTDLIIMRVPTESR